MRLVSLQIAGFRGIQRAKLGLEPGLNILHGPNDLGKSTLAEAIRAVLLLAHGQKEHESFIPWTEDVAPKVELELELGERAFYRVSKTFGEGARGQSVLSFSRDGLDFSVTHKGREVDEELRKLLRWGVPAPGGKAKNKGMPDTFLTEVLMPDQNNPARVLEVSLQHDKDESGKEQLRQILEALAVDPLFKKVLDGATAKVDEAYSANGKRRGGKSSPWVEARDRINEAKKEIDRLRDDVAKSEDAENKIRELSAQLEAQRGKVETAEKKSAVLKVRLGAQEQRRVIEGELEAARTALARAEEEFRAVEETQAEIHSIAGGIEAGKERAARAIEATAGAEAAVRAAEEQQSRLANDAGEKERALEKSRLEKELVESEAAAAAAANERERALELARELEVQRAVEKRCGDTAKKVDRLSASRAEMKSAVETAAEVLKESEQLAALSRYHRAKRELEVNEAAIEKKSALVARAEKYRDEIRGIEAQLSSRPLPDRRELGSLRETKQHLEVALAEVRGLALTVRPERSLEVKISADDEAERMYRLDAPQTIEGGRSIRLTIAGVGEVVAVAGRPAARKTAEQLTRRWNEDKRLLDAVGAGDLDALASMVDEADRARARLQTVRRDLSSTEATIAELTPRDALELGSEMERAEVSLRGAGDRAGLAKKLEKIGADRLDLHQAKMRRQHEEANEELRRIELELAKVQAEQGRDETALREQREKLAPRLTALGAAPDLASARAEEKEQAGISRAGEVRRRLQALESEAKTALVEAAAQLEAVRAALEAAKEAQRRADADLDELSRRHAASRARFEERKKRADAEDRKTHHERVSGLEQRLKLSPADPSVTGESVRAAAGEIEKERVIAEKIDDAIHAARGALELVGGSVIKEQQAECEEALQIAERDQQELDIEYEAWRLLVDGLKAAEKEQAGHLGRAVVEPISRRFAELTRGRYPRLSIGADLETQAVVVDGGEREVQALSVGTRDQLATVLRLCLAERLGTCLILDDQLVNSDAARLGWLRDLLYETSRTLQIIVFTCRPEHYVVPGCTCAVVDLSNRVVRYGTGESSRRDANENGSGSENVEYLVSGWPSVSR